MPVLLHASGQLYVAEKLSSMPRRTHRKLRTRIAAITDTLHGRAVLAAPVLTGRLRSEITSRLYSDNPSRVAGYVFVAAPAGSNEFAKAATLEYGSDKPRAVANAKGVMTRLAHQSRRIRARMSKPAHIRAYRYLRGPLAETAPEFLAAVAEVVGETTAEAG